MKKADAERAIRHLCGEWSRETGTPTRADADPSFQDFRQWVEDNGYGDCLFFRSTVGARADVERWFDEEFQQTWRN